MRPSTQELINQVADEMAVIAEELGERAFLEAPSDSKAWRRAAGKVIRAWRKRQNPADGSLHKGAAASHRR
jgi:hypothetical protein